MSIDRIGKGGASGPTGAGAPSSPASGPVSGSGQVFEVRKSERPQASENVANVKAAATPLERVRAGQIDVNTYMDQKVTEATAHLRGLRPSELESIQRMLRDKLASDPALADLVKGATGHMPVPQDD